MLVWRWRRTADPNAPRRPDGRPARMIDHPLAHRAGERCSLIAQSATNGSRLVEFADGFRTVAPFHATRAA